MKSKKEENSMEFVLLVVLPILGILASYARKKFEEKRTSELNEAVVNAAVSKILEAMRKQLPPA